MLFTSIIYLYKDLYLPDAPRIKQLDEFLEGCLLTATYIYCIRSNFQGA